MPNWKHNHHDCGFREGSGAAAAQMAADYASVRVWVLTLFFQGA